MQDLLGKCVLGMKWPAHYGEANEAISLPVLKDVKMFQVPSCVRSWRELKHKRILQIMEQKIEIIIVLY